MVIIIPTIPHTGTKFTAHLLKGELGWVGMNGDPVPDSIHVGHIRPDTLEHILPKVKEYPTVIPLRHPYLVGESWRRKNHDEEPLLWAYKAVIEELSPYTDFFFPIDTPDRQTYLDQINEGLGTSYKTDWAIRNSQSKTYDLTWRDVEPSSEMVSFVKTHQEFINRFWPT